MEPILETKGGHTRARLHQDFKISKLVLVSTSGRWKEGNFGTVLRITKELAEDINIEFVGALLRLHSDFIREKIKNEGSLKSFKESRFSICKGREN